MSKNKKFSFGKNWQKYLEDSYNEERLNEAIKSIKDFMEIDNLKGKIFMDIGCGSGLFSAAAFKLNAKKIISFDVDLFAVKCCKHLKNKLGNPNNWEVFKGSVLDDSLISKLPKADAVYSWGVLHHTGNMWKAIKNAARLVNDNGYFYIAIYNKVETWGSSHFWLKVKKLYNRLPKAGKLLMELFYMLMFFLKKILFFRNPFKVIKSYKTKRGMSWRRDITDWLGGYPYEFATIEEVFNFCNKKLGLTLINIKSTNTRGNNQFLFKKV